MTVAILLGAGTAASLALGLLLGDLLRIFARRRPVDDVDLLIWPEEGRSSLARVQKACLFWPLRGARSFLCAQRRGQALLSLMVFKTAAGPGKRALR